MLGTWRVAVGIIALGISSGAAAGQAARIDASTDSSAQASWDKMFVESNDETKCKLRAALLQITSGTAVEKGLRGISLHAAMQDPSVARIKDKLSDLSAEQIIELGQQLSPMQVDCGPGKA